MNQIDPQTLATIENLAIQYALTQQLDQPTTIALISQKFPQINQALIAQIVAKYAVNPTPSPKPKPTS